MTKAEAKRAALALIQPINDLVEGIEHRRKTMAQLIQKWERDIKPLLKFSTQQSYVWAFRRIQAAFGHAAVAEIGRSDVQSFLTDAAKHLAPESVRDLRARLSGLFTQAEIWGWISPGTNPAKGRLRLPEREHVREKRLLTPEQFRKLVADLEQPYSTIVTIAVLGGLRRGELAALRWNDLAQPGKIVVDESVYCGRLGTPKTRKSRRVVAVGQTVAQAIEEWRTKAKRTGPNDFLFGARKNVPIDLHNALARHIRPACERLQLPRVSWHDLRHTFTTWGRLSGIAPEILRDQLGHASVTMTMDVYSHLDNRMAEAALLEQYAQSGRREPQPAIPARVM